MGATQFCCWPHAEGRAERVFAGTRMLAVGPVVMSVTHPNRLEVRSPIIRGSYHACGVSAGACVRGRAWTSGGGQNRAEMTVASSAATSVRRRALRSGDSACSGSALMFAFTRLLSARSFSITCAEGQSTIIGFYIKP